MPRSPSRENISTKREKIATLAKQTPKLVFTTLAHHIDVEWLHEAYRRTRKSGAAGIDGVTAAEYEADLEGNLKSLLDRFKSGKYRAPAVRRVHIPKDGAGRKTRPIGIPTLEDKVLQRAVTMVLEAVYEQDFLDCSYGFRPRRSAHDALAAMREPLMEMGGAWVIDADIKGYFDTIDHGKLREILDQRVRDGVIRRAIDKWLKAGVMEDGSVSYSDLGTPQGGVITPPTMLPKAPVGGLNKRARIHPVYYLDLVFIHLHTLHQRPHDFSPRGPVRVVQSFANGR